MISSLNQIINMPQIFIVCWNQCNIPFSPYFFYAPSLYPHPISNQRIYNNIRQKKIQLSFQFHWLQIKEFLLQKLNKKNRILPKVSKHRMILKLIIIIIEIMLIKGRFQILKGYQNNHVTIGFGSYGQVKLARDIQTGSIVAVKVINKIAKNEVIMHNGLTHNKIIKLIDVYIDTDREITYMILQYADGGTLFQKLKIQQLSKKEIRAYFRDVCEGLAYLHHQNIMHRDVKPQNILLTKNNQAKLCDFGFAAILGERKTLCGTYEYMSPEMIQNRPYDHKIDIWALGILYFQMIAGNAPFRGQKPEEVLEQMKTKIYFCQKFEEEDINLIKMILRVTPNKRPAISEILQQPILRQSQQKEVSTYSTTITEGSKTTRVMAQQPQQNFKKMPQMQKHFQKQTYPPMYAPKPNFKLTGGVTVYNDVHQIKSLSPMQTNRAFSNNYQNVNAINHANFKPVSQPSSNSPFNGIGSIKPYSQPQTNTPQGYNYYPPHNFGRLS